jgi:hypothetical protein
MTTAAACRSSMPLQHAREVRRAHPLDPGAEGRNLGAMPHTAPTEDASDPSWTATARFLEGRVPPGLRVIAPASFAPVLGPLAEPDPSTVPDWAVVALRGAETPPALLRLLLARTTPIFANDGFVVFSRRPTFGLADMRTSAPVRALADRAAGLEQPPAPTLTEASIPKATQTPEATMAPLAPPAAPDIPRASMPPEVLALRIPPAPGQAPPLPAGLPPEPLALRVPPAEDRPAHPAYLPPEVPALRVPAAAPAATTDQPPASPSSHPPEGLGLRIPPAAPAASPVQRPALPSSLPPRIAVPTPRSPAAPEPGLAAPPLPAAPRPVAATGWGGLPARIAELLGDCAGRRVAAFGGTGLAAASLATSALVSDAAKDLPEACFDAAILTGDGSLAADAARAVRLLRPGAQVLAVVENADSLGRRLAAALGRPAPRTGISAAALRGALDAAGLLPLRLEGHSLDTWRATADAPPAGLAADDAASALLEEAGEAAGPRHAAWLLCLARRP